jgi:hypothetical protein
MSFVISNENVYVAGLHNLKMRRYNLSIKIKYTRRVIMWPRDTTNLIKAKGSNI